MNPILRLQPEGKNEYALLKFPGTTETIVSRQDEILGKIESYGVNRKVFAGYTDVGQSHSFDSSIEGLQNIASWPVDGEREKMLRLSDSYRKTILSASESQSWEPAFELIFKNVQVWGNGTDVVFIWGVQLSEEEVHDWAGQKIDKRKKENEDKRKEDDEQPKKEEEVNVAKEAGVKSKQEEGEPAKKEEEKAERPEIAHADRSKVKQRWWRKHDWRRWLLWLAIILTFLLWIWLLMFCIRSCASSSRSLTSGVVVQNPLPGRLPDTPNAQVPWNPEQVRTDPIAGPYIANRWNLAFTNGERTYQEFVHVVDSILPANSAKFIYWDDLIGRVQFNWIDANPFDADAVRTALSDFGVLLWPEKLLGNQVIDIQPSARSDFWHLEDIQWTAGPVSTGPASRICVVDDGFDLKSSGLIGASRLALNLVTRDTLVNSSEKRSHGTHVASLACAPPSPNSAFHGVCRNAELVPIQLTNVDEPTFPMTAVIDGVLYAARNGAEVINLSLGGIFPFAEEFKSLSKNQQEEALFEMIEFTKDERRFWSHLYGVLESQGVAVVVAAGNDGMPIEWDPMHSSRFPVYVTAFNKGGTLSSFSNYVSGKVDSLTVVCAPGESIQSFVHGGRLESKSGTSMAAPIVAGAITEMRFRDSTLAPIQIRSRLQNLDWFSDRGGTRLSWAKLFEDSENV